MINYLHISLNFEVKLARLWPTGMHTLPERGHIEHMRVSWNGNQRCVWSFSIVATENQFSIFRVPKRVFCEAGTTFADNG
jgi:hypothetical protein